jgi:hypothetical protein
LPFPFESEHHAHPCTAQLKQLDAEQFGDVGVGVGTGVSGVGEGVGVGVGVSVGLVVGIESVAFVIAHALIRLVSQIPSSKLQVASPFSPSPVLHQKQPEAEQ